MTPEQQLLERTDTVVKQMEAAWGETDPFAVFARFLHDAATVASENRMRGATTLLLAMLSYYVHVPQEFEARCATALKAMCPEASIEWEALNAADAPANGKGKSIVQEMEANRPQEMEANRPQEMEANRPQEMEANRPQEMEAQKTPPAER